RADEILPVAKARPQELHAAVRAHVFHHVHGARPVANENHRTLADRRALEVSGIRDLRFETYIAPMARIEEPFELAAIDFGVGVDPERDPVRALALPRRDRREHGVRIV